MALGHVGEAIEVEAEMLDRLGHADGHRCIRLEARAEPAVDQLGSYGFRGPDEHQGDAGGVEAFDQLGEDVDGRDVDVGDRADVDDDRMQAGARLDDLQDAIPQGASVGEEERPGEAQHGHALDSCGVRPALEIREVGRPRDPAQLHDLRQRPPGGRR